MNMMQAELHNRVAARLLCALFLLYAVSFGLLPATAETASQTETTVATPTDADRALFAELVEANSFSEMMKRHSSKQAEVVYYNEDDEEIHRFTDYVDAKQFAEENSNEHGHIVMDTLHLWSLTDEDGPYLLEVFFDQEEEYSELLASRQEESSLSIEPEETLTEVIELNGCWYMTTEVSDADWVRARLESDAGTSGMEPIYAYADGMRFAYSYTFDAETKDLLEIWTYLREADGTEHSYALDRITYDLEHDLAGSMFAPYYEATEFSTLHLVFAPGTPEESSMTYMIPKSGVYWTVEYQGEEYVGDVYTDPDCTQVYEGGSRPDEITLYIPVQG